jgi:hypothetical protein
MTRMKLIPPASPYAPKGLREDLSRRGVPVPQDLVEPSTGAAL